MCGDPADTVPRQHSNKRLPAEVNELNRQVDNRVSYTPPGDEVLSETQVEQFFRVQDTIRDDLSGRYDELVGKYQQLEAELESAQREPSLRELIGAWNDIASLVVDAKQAQVAALNQANLSLSEYDWIRLQVYRALGYQGLSIGLTELAQNTDNERAITDFTDLAPPPDVNLERVAPYRERFEDYVALALFGL
ncbi:MAG: hypothetical protein U5L04_03530 [Trueperaceae bacterium]|nr:hypothetical protein [Trueperaceae bacterium]